MPPVSEIPVDATAQCAQLLLELSHARSASPASRPTAERIDTLVDALVGHGVAALTWSLLRDSPLREQLSASTRNRLSAIAYSLLAREAATRDALAAALAALHDAGIRVVVFKGEALARTVYAHPATRERGDVDLWVAQADFERACNVLETDGWRADHSTHGRWIQPERTFRRPQRIGLPALDLHRRLFGQALLGDVLPFEAVFERGQAFDAAARMPCAADALLIAVLHRIAHHVGERGRLIWLYDIHLLCTRCPADLAAAAGLARARAVCGLLAEALRSTAACFSTPVDDRLIEALTTAGSGERATRLLQPMSSAARWWFDFRSVPGLAGRLRFAGELLLPSPAYMRWRYRQSSNWLLPWLYLRRALAGLWKSTTDR